VEKGFPIHTGVEDHLPRFPFGIYELQEKREPPLTDAPPEGVVLGEGRDLEGSDLFHLKDTEGDEGIKP
jgi:hypothetical protein